MGFDASVTPEEIAASVAQAGGCSEESVRVGRIRTTPAVPAGHSAHLAVAKKLGLAKKVRVGGWY